MGAVGLQNNPPIADAGPDQIVECTSTCLTEVTMDGSGSYDPDGDILTYHWTWGAHEAFGPSPTVSLPLGTTTIVCVVHDGQATSMPDSVNITIVDTTPPEISVNIQPEQLWPPNHKMVEVTTPFCPLSVMNQKKAPGKNTRPIF
jgi:hypothetical protein